MPMQADLVLRAQAGDKVAFSALATSAVDRLHAVARLVVRDPDGADDAVQEALIAAWRDLRGLRDPERFDAWLYRILIRCCNRAAKQRHQRHMTEIQLTDDGAGPMSSDLAVGVDLRDQLDRAFRRLAVDQRAVLVLHHYLGLPLAASAEILSIPVGTMKSRVNRATQAMRASLEAEDRQTALVTERTT
jgi:RNA polymerase sigma factor (sigma-70 family)